MDLRRFIYLVFDAVLYRDVMGNVATRIQLLVLALLMALPSPASSAQRAASGIFLVASRTIRDPNFGRTVILVTQAPGGGPVGVIINRPLEQRLSELFPQYEALKDSREVVYFGGPVARDGLVFVVRLQEPPARGMHVLNDVYLTGDADAVRTLLSRRNPTEGVRVYSGYSGWAPSQLKNEIDRGDWYLLPADDKTIFEKRTDRIWPELVARAMLRKTELLFSPAGSNFAGLSASHSKCDPAGGSLPGLAARRPLADRGHMAVTANVDLLPRAPWAGNACRMQF